MTLAVVTRGRNVDGQLCQAMSVVLVDRQTMHLTFFNNSVVHKCPERGVVRCGCSDVSKNGANAGCFLDPIALPDMECLVPTLGSQCTGAVEGVEGSSSWH